MDAEGKRIWAALCKAGATEEDRAEAADQRAQADEEKAEAERNIADSDRLKEAARIRTALGFKEAVTPSEAIAIQQNRVNTVRRELLEPAMSEEDDDESSDKKAMDRYPPIRVPRGWRPSEEQSSGCEEDYMDEWNSDFFKTCETFIKRVLVPAFKKRRWTVDGADCEHAYDWEEEGAECWIEISGKGGQKIGLAGRKHIVLDRNVSEDVHFNILPAVEDMEFEGSEQFDVDEFADWTWDAECPIDEIESLEFQGASFPPTPSGVDKFMQAVDRYWIRKSGVRSKIKRNALKREGQAIREALGFPKEAGESFYATDNAVELAAQIAREINKRGGRARVVKGPYGPEKNLVMAATIEIPSMGGTFKDVRIEVTEGEWSQQPSINARFGSGRGHGLPLGKMGAGLPRLGWGDAKKVVDGMEEGVEWLMSHRRAALGFPKEAGRFNLGRVVQTRGVNSKSRENRAFGREVMDAFRKYQRGDWGDTQSDSKRRNNAVLRGGEPDQIFAVYNTSEGKIYIITEWDGSVTTILFSHEY